MPPFEQGVETLDLQINLVAGASLRAQGHLGVGVVVSAVLAMQRRTRRRRPLRLQAFCGCRGSASVDGRWCTARIASAVVLLRAAGLRLDLGMRGCALQARVDFAGSHHGPLKLT